MVEENRPRLGRGLAALLGDTAPEAAPNDRPARRLPVEFIRPNPRNPRKSFSEESLDELSSSIREKGLLQPIIVRGLDDQGRHYEIIAGERRWRASQKAGLHDVPVIILNVSERESLELAIVENVQRSDLNPIEEARGYNQLMHEFNYTQIDLSKIIGKSRSHIANTLRLLNLPDSVLTMVEAGELTAGHARTLLGFENPHEIARKIVDDHLNVRDVEELARRKGSSNRNGLETKAQAHKIQSDPNFKDMEKLLSDSLGMKVEIRPKGEDAGELRVRYDNMDQLNAICDRLRS